MIDKALNLISHGVLADGVDITSVGTDTGLKAFSLTAFVNMALNALIGFAGLIFFVMLVIGGIQYAMSGGDKAQAQAAKDRITNALIGIVVVASAFAIKALITSVFGIAIGKFEITAL